MSALPPAGWYDDPEHPEQLRYWGGDAWTEHRAPKTAPPGSGVTSSGLSDIGDWLQQTFQLPFQRWKPLGLVVVTGLILSFGISLVLISVWEDALYVDGEWSGVSWSRLWISIVLILLTIVVTVIVHFVLVHQLYHARLGLHPGLDESARASLRAIPRLLGWGLLIVASVIVAIFAIAILFVLSSALGVLLLIAAIPFAIWGAVKLSFLEAAFVVPVDGQNPIQASAAVSKGRWWPVFGRLLLLAVIVTGSSIVTSLLVSPFTGTFDEDDFDEYIVVDDRTDELIYFEAKGMIDELGVGGVPGFVASVPGAVLTVFAVAGPALLYAETHRKRPDDPGAGLT